MTISSMTTSRIPHPIPYQGSKRKLCPSIAKFVPDSVRTLYEPFAGSAAFSLFAARNSLAERFVIGDVLEPLIELWRLIVSKPGRVSNEYQKVWEGQKTEDTEYFYKVRHRYNNSGDPVLLLYLITRCVKNAVRFSKDGRFTQSVDKRRLGMQPEKMRHAVFSASALLATRVEFYAGDFEGCISEAGKSDLIYMDPPYQGTTYGADKRYYQGLEVQRLCGVLSDLNDRGVPFILSYDGRHGDKEYGMMLPENLNTKRLLIDAGRSSQATLNGKNVITLEALYISQALTSVRIPKIEALALKQMALGI